MVVYSGAEVRYRCPIALGFSPAGDKQREGDGRTPEGIYRIDRKNAGSADTHSVGLDKSVSPSATQRFAIFLRQPSWAPWLRSGLGDEADGGVFIAPEVEGRTFADHGGAFEFANQLIPLGHRGDDKALKYMARAVVDIDQTTQLRGKFRVQNHAIMPKAQDGKDRLAHLDAQAGFAALFGFAGLFQPIAYFF